MPLPTSPLRKMHRAVRAFLLHDGLPIGGIAVGVMLGTYALLGATPSGPLLVLAFCGTALVYQFDRTLGFSPEDRYNRPERHAWGRAHRGFVWSTALLCIAAAGVALTMIRPAVVLAGAALGALGLLYVAPVLGRRLKSLGWGKPLVVAGTWALGGVLLPALEAGRAVTLGVVALVAYRFVIVLANALLADWADRVGDTKAGLRTVAARWPARAVFRRVRGLLGAALVGGVAVAVGYGLPLLGVDLVGVVLMLGIVGRIEARATPMRRLALDAVVAWPLVTALAGWAAAYW